MVEDPVERDLPKLGLLEIQDPESGEVMLIDSSSKTFREAYSAAQKKKYEEREKEFRKSQIERINVVNNEQFVDPLIAYFRQKSGRK